MGNFRSYDETTDPGSDAILLVVINPTTTPQTKKCQVINLGALRALSNLASVAINADMDPGSDNAIDLGNGSKMFKDIYLYQMLLKERSAPSTPASGLNSLYSNTSGILHFLNDNGDDFSLGIYPDILISAPGIRPRSDNGCGAMESYETSTYKVIYDGLPFDKDSDEFGQCQIPLPRDYNSGTMQFKFYWWCKSGIGSASETVQFAIQGLSIGDNESLDQDWGTAQVISDTWQADEKMHITGWTPAMTLAGTPADQEFAKFQIYRDVSEDNLGGDAYLSAVLGKFTRT